MLTELEIARLIEDFAEAKGLSIVGASMMVSQNSRTYSNLQKGRTLHYRKAREVMINIDVHWPNSVPIPDELLIYRESNKKLIALNPEPVGRRLD